MPDARAVMPNTELPSMERKVRKAFTALAYTAKTSKTDARRQSLAGAYAEVGLRVC